MISEHVYENSRGGVVLAMRREPESEERVALQTAERDCRACVESPLAQRMYPGLDRLELDLRMWTPLYICPAVSWQHNLSGTLLVNETGFIFADDVRPYEWDEYSGRRSTLPPNDDWAMHWTNFGIRFKKRWYAMGIELILNEEGHRYQVGKHVREDIERIHALLMKRPKLSTKAQLVDGKLSDVYFHRHVSEDVIEMSSGFPWVKEQFLESQSARDRLHAGYNGLALSLGMEAVEDWAAVDEALCQLDW